MLSVYPNLRKSLKNESKILLPPTSIILENNFPSIFKNFANFSNFDCTRVLANDQAYIRQKSEFRITYKDSDEMETDCQAIKRRNYFPTNPGSQIEAAFPLAFAKNVYKGYLFLEMELAAEYAPQNFYCYTIDQKSTEIFKTRIRDLSKCFSNVIVADTEFDTNSDGINNNYALMECLRLLSNRKWEYVFTLENNDVIMRTNYELVQILKSFGGANDIMVNHPNMERVNVALDWSFSGLEIFTNKTLNKNIRNDTSTQMRWAKGNFQSTISRKMVDFMLTKLNLTKFLDGLEGTFGVNEMFLSTLQATDELKVPGGFSSTCLDKNIEVNHATRYNIWEDRNDANTCQTRIWRHALCIFGMEDLHRLARLPHFFANKMLPDVDFGAIVCWHEHIFNRSHVYPQSYHVPDYYLSMPHIRYHRERANKSFNINSFDCNFEYDGCSVDLNCI